MKTKNIVKFPQTRARSRAKVILRVEKDGKYVERVISHRIICSLFDWQFAMTATGNRIAEFNGLDKDIEKFFKIISFIDDSSHEPVMYQWVAGSKFRIINKTGKDYIFGKPRWKRIR